MAISVVVVGAGAFGGWTALHLLRAGCKVTLVDAWGPGHSRSSSGDDSRVIRGSYGPNAVYTEMVQRCIPMWKENERRWGVKLFHQAGALWIAGKGDDSYEKASLANIRKAGMAHEVIESATDGTRRWPQMNWDGLAWAIYEKEAGYLLARRACQAVMEGFVAENGAYLQAEARTNGESNLPAADAYVFACGPWLGRLFPDVLGKLITPTRQEMFYFGTPAGDTRFNDDRFPTWVDNSPKRFYGIPGTQWRGFKLAQDVPGAAIDPTTMDRTVTPEGIALMRGYLAYRFPAIATAPLVETRVCQYEMSPDGGLIVDRHPSRNNVWLVGGGSGHGFKFGPALGEHVAALVLGKAKQKPQFALSRFGKDAGGVGERK